MEGKDLFIQQYLNGKKVDDIASEHGITPEAVYVRLRAMPDWKKIKKLKRERKMLNTLDSLKQATQKLKELKHLGLSTTKAAQQLGIDYRLARKLLRGTKYDSSKKAKQYRNKNIKREYDLGKTQQQLAEKYNLPQQSISKIILKQKGSK
jgi:Mor family transcriptional regulator